MKGCVSGWIMPLPSPVTRQTVPVGPVVFVTPAACGVRDFAMPGFLIQPDTRQSSDSSSRLVGVFNVLCYRLSLYYIREIYCFQPELTAIIYATDLSHKNKVAGT